MLEPTATAAKSVAESRPAMIVSIVPLPTTARFAMKSGHPSLTKARVDVSGAARLSGRVSCGRSEVRSVASSVAFRRGARVIDRVPTPGTLRHSALGA